MTMKPWTRCSVGIPTSSVIPTTARWFWLALALTQSKVGRLREDVKQRALSIIDEGADLSTAGIPRDAQEARGGAGEGT